jgi:hypothetical protein
MGRVKRKRSDVLRQGSAKQRKTQFKKGICPFKRFKKATNDDQDLIEDNSDNAPSWKRLDLSDFTCIVNEFGDILDICDAHGTRLFAHLLRPRSTTPPEQAFSTQDDIFEESEMETNRIFNMSKLLDLINDAAEGHRQHNPFCTGDFKWNFSVERQHGLGWSQSLECEECNYKQPLQKLYNEVTTNATGRRAAHMNVQLQVGLAHTMISNTAFQRILATINVPPPAYSGMHYQSNKVSKKLVEIGEIDMKEQRMNIRRLNNLKGVPLDEVNVSIDSRYNNGLCSGRGRTPFQAGTQQVTTMMENTTGHNMIIALNLFNKLCLLGVRGREKQAICPPHEGECSQTLHHDESIGDEKRASQVIMQSILSDENSAVKPRYTTSDLDSHSVQGISSTLDEPTVHLYDTRHFGQSLCRALENKKFSDDAFPGSTQAERARIQKNFAKNLTSRMNAEYKIAYDMYGNDLDLLKNKLSFVVDAVTACFNNNCGALCQSHSFVCSGTDDAGSWNHDYMDKNNKDSTTCFVQEDLAEIRALVNRRLGKDGVDKTRFNTNTQGLEALHRKYSASNPKIVTMARNAPGRLYSTSHLHNHGIAESTRIKLEFVNAPLTKNSRPAVALAKMDKVVQQRQAHQDTTAAKAKRAETRRANHQMHTDKRMKVTYEKDVMLRQSKSIAKDHTYISKHIEHPYHK